MEDPAVYVPTRRRKEEYVGTALLRIFGLAAIGWGLVYLTGAVVWSLVVVRLMEGLR